MFESGVKLFDSSVKSFGLDVKTASGKVYKKLFVVYNDEENVDCHEKPMTAFVRVITET